MTDEPREAPRRPDPGMIKAWADYAKSRFATADGRIAEYRAWARQLIAAIGVVIGLEVAVVARLALDTTLPLASVLRGLSLVLLLIPLAVQFLTIRHLLHVGYRGEGLLGPEAPTKLADYLVDRDETEAHRVIGAYYAKSFDHFHDLAERLGARVGSATATFQWTLPPVLLGVALLAIGALWAPPQSVSLRPMASEPPCTMPTPPRAAFADRALRDEFEPEPNPRVAAPTAEMAESHGSRTAGK